MAIGIPINKADLDNRITNASRSLKSDVAMVRALNNDVMALPDAAFTSLGYTTDEVASIRDWSSKLDTLYQVFTGAVGLPSPVNFAAALAPYWGVGL